VILATWEVEVEGLEFEASSGKVNIRHYLKVKLKAKILEA
jgi:hypothetical protein